jgi:hypothetical protein
VGPPFSLSKGERHPDQELAIATAADSSNMNSSVDGHRRRPTTSTIDNSPALNNRGIYQEKKGKKATVTGSLLQKPVTVTAGNLGSCKEKRAHARLSVHGAALDIKI